MSVNKVILIGNIGRDPEVRYTPAGAAVCTLSVATSRSWKNKTTGQREEEAEWHRVVMYDKLAEIAGEHLKKGKSVYIEGRLKTRKWQNKEGADQYTTEIIAHEMTMLGGRGEQEQQAAPRDAQAPKPQAKQPALADMDDDIPF